MSNTFDELRERIKEVSRTDASHLEEILLAVVYELEKIYNETRQGYTKPK